MVHSLFPSSLLSNNYFVDVMWKRGTFRDIFVNIISTSLFHVLHTTHPHYAYKEKYFYFVDLEILYKILTFCLIIIRGVTQFVWHASSSSSIREIRCILLTIIFD